MLKNHPRGLMVLFFTEMWERFGFYIMMAIFYLYMDETLGWSDDRKGDYYGAFVGLVYFIPILGGYLGDRVLGQRDTIRIGAVLMTIGYVTLALSSVQRLAFFYAGLVLVAVGTGLFKANISVLVGNLYEEGSRLKDAAFNIFYMGVNLGAALAPLAATFISVRYGSYNLSFAVAAVGMILSMVIFQWGSRHLVSVQTARSTPSESAKESRINRPRLKVPVLLIVIECVVIFLALQFWWAYRSGNEMFRLPAYAAGGLSFLLPIYAWYRRLPPEDRPRVASLFTLFIIAIFFWVGFYQNGASLTLFAKRSTRIYDWLKPETYQVFNPLFILLLTPLLVAAFGRLREKGREPSSASKIFGGMVVMGFSVLIMVLASLAGGNRDENIMSPMWLVSTYFLVTISEILVSPMGLSFVSKVSPQRMRGLMMGGWFAATAIGGYGSGLLGKYYSRFDHHNFFLIIAAMTFCAALLVLPFLKRLNRFSGSQRYSR